MRQVVVSKQLTAASANAAALAQTLGAAGNFTLNGASATAGVVTFDTARRVLFTSAGDDSGISFTLTGTNGSGTPITETVTGANAATATSLQDFATLTRVSASAATAGNVQIGTSSVGSTPWQVPNQHITPFLFSVGLELLSGGSTNVTIEVTDDSPLMPIPIYQAGYSQAVPVPKPAGWPGLTGVVCGAVGLTALGSVNSPVAAWRLTVNSGTGLVQAAAQQAGIRN